MATEPDPDNALLRDEARRIRAAGVLGRSDVLPKLFDFLLSRSFEHKAPKEFEIAQEVFGKDSNFDVALDASVRVHVHRLRRKLDDYYAHMGVADAPRLSIPRGEYRLVLAAGATSADPPADIAGPGPVTPAAYSPPRSLGLSRSWLAASGAVLLLAVALLGVLVGRWQVAPARTPSAVKNSALWRHFGVDRPLVVVIGDYFIFGEAQDGVEVNRLVREYAINSREDLDRYLMNHPERVGQYVGLDLTYTPVGSVGALGTVLPLLDRGRRRVTVLPISALTADMLRTANIVYIGYFSGLGLLRDDLFAASRLKVGKSYDELIERKTGRRFTADWSVSSEGGMPHRDFAYLATMPGPNGNWVTIIAGTRDAALLQAASVASDPAQLARMRSAAGSGDAIEALFRVDSLANRNLGGALVLAGPLDTSHLWQAHDHAPDAYPDEPEALSGAP